MTLVAIQKPLSAGIAVSFALGPTFFVASLRQGYGVDPESVFIMLAGALAIVDRRVLALGVTLAARRGLVLVAACVVAMTFALDWGRVIILAAPVVLVAAAWILNTRPRLAALAVVAFFALDLGYVIYMEDLGGAQDGIIDVGPAPYEIR